MLEEAKTMWKANLKTPLGDGLRHWLEISIILIVLACPDSIARIIYVDHDANGLNDGSSWENAYTFLQDGLSYARSDPNADEVRVAQGTYKPDANSADPNGSGDRYATFELINGVALKGGYAGFGHPDPNACDGNLYTTILSGDLSGNDSEFPIENLPSDPNRSENSLHVVTASGTDETALLSAFVITGGSGGNSGGGIYISGGGPMISKCSFENNSAGNGGGFACRDNSNPQVFDCTFIRNSTGIETGSGGGVSSNLSTIKLFNCTFKQNIARNSTGMSNTNGECTLVTCKFIENEGLYGNALYLQGKTNGPDFFDTYCTLINCIFTGNLSRDTIRPSGLFIDCVSNAVLTNCIFNGNSGAAIHGSAAFYKCCVLLTNCTISGNIGNKVGGISNNENSRTQFTLANCILWGNRNSSGMSESAQISGGAVVKSSCIMDDDPNDSYIPFGGSANNNIDDNPKFVREPNDGGDGWSVGDNDDFGDLHLLTTSPCIDVGDNNSLPSDITDIDGDANTTELIPWDLDRRARIVDGDCNETNIVDMGAYEFSYAYLGDFDNQCDVDFDDLKEIANHWLQKEPLFDIAPPPIGDGIVNFKDLAVLAEHWLEGTTP